LDLAWVGVSSRSAGVSVSPKVDVNGGFDW
jgi:hypothetical protein